MVSPPLQPQCRGWLDCLKNILSGLLLSVMQGLSIYMIAFNTFLTYRSFTLHNPSIWLLCVVRRALLCVFCGCRWSRSSSCPCRARHWPRPSALCWRPQVSTSSPTSWSCPTSKRWVRSHASLCDSAWRNMWPGRLTRHTHKADQDRSACDSIQKQRFNLSLFIWF